MINVLFFGPVAERVGHSNLSLPFTPDLTVQNLYDQLQTRHPSAFAIVCFTALNGEMLRDLSPTLSDGDEVVFMSKFSGG